MCLAQGHNVVTLVRLEPAAPWSRVKHSATALPYIILLQDVTPGSDITPCSGLHI